MMMQKINGFLRFLMAVIFLFCFAPSSFGATVDVMIVYDSTAKSWVDSNGGMNAFAADAVARMNQATANSGVNLTFRLAHADVVSYTYSGDSSLGLDLDRLTAGSSTYNMNVVHTWRDTYGADVVVMLVDTGFDYGTVGLGWLLTQASGLPNYAYSVCAIRSVADSHTMTHEVGHNFGCDHAKHMLPASVAGPGLYSYSAGWYYTGTNSVPYCTIMAYNNDGYGNIYVETPYFSSPLVSYQGTLTGDAADGDNARTLRNTMDVVAAYRTASTNDTTPDQFTFIDQTGVALNTVITSNTITVSGINTAAPISITGGTYSINGGPYTSSSGTVNNGNTVTVRQTSSGNYSTTTSATLTIGGISDTFSVTTISSSSGGGGEGGGGGCFIATAAFGSPMAGQVEILRQFRDRYLLTNAPGQKFVAWYYRNGPAAANYIKDKPLIKAAVRMALYPLIGFSLLLINGILPYLLLAITGFIIFFRFRTKKLSAT
jgi:hypothetical protein